MIRIFKDKHNEANYVVQSTCIDSDAFIAELSESLVQLTKTNDDYAIFSVMKVAVPILFKLSGYKADEVREERMMLCGNVAPENCDVIASSGR
jgi:hypothetical protein